MKCLFAAILARRSDEHRGNDVGRSTFEYPGVEITSVSRLTQILATVRCTVSALSVPDGRSWARGIDKPRAVSDHVGGTQSPRRTLLQTSATRESKFYDGKIRRATLFTPAGRIAGQRGSFRAVDRIRGTFHVDTAIRWILCCSQGTLEDFRSP